MNLNALEWEINLLSKMVEVDTESVSKKGYDKCASIIIEAAKRNSLATEVIDGEGGAEDGLSRPNVIVTLDSGSEATLLIEGHFDIVPPGPNWKYPPFKLTVERDRAYGRGTADNKAGIAAALGAMRLLRHEKLDINLKLIAGVDEEIGGRYGLDYVLTDRKLKGDAALIVDAGSDRLYLGACGIIWGKVIVEGKQGHAGSPFKAKNAIEEAVRLFTALDPYRKAVEKKKSVLRAPPDAPKKFVWGRYTVTMFHGGEKENVIPGICEFRFDRRLLPEESPDQAEKELEAYFKQALQKADCKGKLEITNKTPGYHTPKNLVFVQTVSRSIKKTIGKKLPFAGELGGNDGSFFAKNGIPVVSYGTIGTDTRYHSTDEFVYLKHIENVRNLIVNLGKVKKEEIAR
jgi:succinyl-diaminopimelate desuccinylase